MLAFEDLHWADPTSLDLMRALAERGAQAPLLIIATARPEFRPPWSVRSHHSAISLSPLDRVQIAKMVAELAAHHALPRDIVEGVSERTGGVPLFVEEVTRLLLERGEQGGAQAIPPTLQQSLAARLDRLGAAREAAQIGAVLGRGFSYALLQSVAGLDEGALQSALERLAEADILFVEGDGAQATYRFKHALIQDAAYDSLLKSRRQALHARAAEILRESASPEPEAVAHHFTEAGLDDLAIEWWGKAGDQALRRSAFQEAIAHLGKAIDMADMAAATGRRAVGGPVAPTQHLTQLHVAYGNALIAARGYSAPETAEAFARARESASGDADAPGRLAADYGLWAGSYMRGDLPSMRAHAEAFLSDLEASPDSPEASVAHRAAGMTCWFAGGYREARGHLERALALFEPGRDDDLTFRFAWDPGVAAMASLAIVSWSLGEVDRAISLMDRMQTRIAGLTDVGTLAVGRMHAAMFELMRGDHLRAAQNAFELARLAREHDLNLWRAFGVFLQGWAASQSGALADGLEDMRRGAALLREQNALLYDGLLKVALAGARGRGGRPGPRHCDPRRSAVDVRPYRLSHVRSRTASGARRTSVETRPRQSRSRGRSLPDRHRHRTKARNAQLRAARVAGAGQTLSIDRPTGRGACRPRARARGLCADYGNARDRRGAGAADGARGDRRGQSGRHAAAATDAVARRLRQRAHRGARLRRGGNDRSVRQGARVGSRRQGRARTVGGRLRLMGRQLRARRVAIDAGARGGLPQRRRGETRIRPRPASPIAPPGSLAGSPANIARRGIIWNARSPCSNPAATTIWLFVSDRTPASPQWPIWRSRHGLWARSIARFRSSTACRRGSRASPMSARSRLEDMYAAMFELMRGDRARAAPNAFELARLAREHDLRMFRAFGVFLEGWATAASGAPGGGLEGMRRGVELLREQNVLFFDGLLKIALAEAEARAGDPARAVAILDEALATCDRTGSRAFEAELHRARGEILLKRDPANPAPAEEAFLTAIAIAKQQGARSFELRAALCLAKLYRSTARPAKAHAVLAPALEGFPPTPEMPEIAEAQALLTALAETDEVKADAAQRRRLTHLHVSYGNALIAARGYGAPETTEAFAKARQSAAGDKDAPGRLSADYGLWVGSFTRGELPEMRAHAAAFLSDVEARPEFARGRRRPSRRRRNSLVRRRVRAGAGSLGTSACIVPTRPRRRHGLPFRTGSRRLHDGVSSACIVASRRDRACDILHVADVGADSVPLPWQHDRPRTHVRRPICFDAWRPHAREGKFPGTCSNSPARTISHSFAPSECFSMGGRGPRATCSAGSTACAVASTACVCRTSLFLTVW